MKTFYSTAIIFVFLLVCTNVIQAQTPQAKLNQVELEKQFIGTWKSEIAKDTIMYAEFTQFGLMKGNIKVVTKDKILDSGEELFGYDKETDKSIQVTVWKSSTNIDINAWQFVSNNIKVGVPIKDISNRPNATLKFKIEFKSPDLWVMTTLQNNQVVGTVTMTRVKK
jgi:hypothetical protein